MYDCPGTVSVSIGTYVSVDPNAGELGEGGTKKKFAEEVPL